MYLKMDLSILHYALLSQTFEHVEQTAQQYVL